MADEPVKPQAQVHPTCVLGEDVELGAGVVLEPLVVLGDGVRLGEGCHVESGAVLGDGVTAGPGCRVQAGAVLRDGVRLGCRVTVGSGAVLGSDGFGFVEDGGSHHKIAQVGTVEVGDDVVIAANACIDRATLGVTRIASAVRIGALAQLGHNVVVERGVQLGAQVGLAGSSHLEEGVNLAPGAGVAPHVRVGANSRVGFRAGVIKSLPAGSEVEGFPARPAAEAAALVELLGQAASLGARVRGLEQRLGGAAVDGNG